MKQRITREQVEESRRILRAAYYQEVNDIADEALREYPPDCDESEDRYDWIAESVDGSEWVRYTANNLHVMLVSDAEYEDDFDGAQTESQIYRRIANDLMRQDVTEVVSIRLMEAGSKAVTP